MNRYPSRIRAIKILREAGCPEGVIRHGIAVANIAMQMVRGANLGSVDINLVEIGALLHDLGRSRTRSVKHGFLGGKMATRLGLDDRLANVIANHVGAGIPAKEARELGLPSRDYLPRTMEERIVCYADKLAAKDKRMSYEEAQQQMVEQLGLTHPAIRRFEKLHEEMLSLGINNAEPYLVREDIHDKKQRISPSIDQ